MIIDLFSGPDGWGTGLRLLRRTDVVGLECDVSAVATARAAGHKVAQVTLGAKPATYDIVGHVEGVIASPPCPGFSAAGLKLGRGDIPMILNTVHHMGIGMDRHLAIEAVQRVQTDKRSALSLEPLRWVLDLNPEWTVWEQVPSVLPLWDACAEVLRAAGYAVWTGKVHAEQYGVPQARTRAVLVASRRQGPMPYQAQWLAPVPTHSRYHARSPRVMDERVREWVSMARGLAQVWPGWSPTPANPGTTADDMQWAFRRPAPTMVGTFRPDVAAKPAWRKAGDTPRQKAPCSILLTVREAGVLQSFPWDYPWQGSVAQQHLQVGNAVPPLMAAAILRQVL